ncbi:hypothetical protein [Leptospira noguchii]|uniref:Uncharacterized protein n=1 Tax=Leptospira noguchii TaxID=28182 RepID=A0AAE9GIQ6_9LEPT|nr:hypothetical protein [Leptospira noguchii]UOG58707.1 hypothetical protein MAL03_18785 [Leptospira noguchii]
MERKRTTQRLASTVARGNSASRFYGRSRKLSVSLLRSLEETQRLASTVARQVVSQSTMKFASDSPQFSYVELTLLRTN